MSAIRASLSYSSSSITKKALYLLQYFLYFKNALSPSMNGISFAVVFCFDLIFYSEHSSPHPSSHRHDHYRYHPIIIVLTLIVSIFFLASSLDHPSVDCHFLRPLCHQSHHIHVDLPMSIISFMYMYRWRDVKNSRNVISLCSYITKGRMTLIFMTYINMETIK